MQPNNASAESQQCIRIYQFVDDRISYGVSTAGGEKLAHTANRVLIEVFEEIYENFKDQLIVIDGEHTRNGLQPQGDKAALTGILMKLFRDYTITERRNIANTLHALRDETLNYKQSVIQAFDVLNHQDKMEKLIGLALLAMTELCDKSLLTIMSLTHIYTERVYRRHKGLTATQHAQALGGYLTFDQKKVVYTWADGKEISADIEKAKLMAMVSLLDLEIDNENNKRDELGELFKQL